MTSWIPLHVHSEYSILDSNAGVSTIAKAAKADGMSAVALTDHGNMYGAVDFFSACRSEGIKPIIGCNVYVAPGSRLDKTKGGRGRVAHHLVLLAKDDIGYRNLCRLSSIGFTEGFYYYPRIDKEVLEQYCQGLICIAGGRGSEVVEVALDENDRLEEVTQWYRTLFGDDFYLEIQRHPMSQEKLEAHGFLQESWLYDQYQSYIDKQNLSNQRIQAVGAKLGIGVVATNDSHYISPDDWKAHEILINIQSGQPCEIWEKDSLGNNKNRVPNPKRRTYATHELYFKSQAEMADLFADCPEVLSTTLEVADKCHLELDFDTQHYPVYTPRHLEGQNLTAEERKAASEAFLRKLCEDAISKRYTTAHLEKVKSRYPDRDPLDVVRDRLEDEMSVIIPKGMCDYLLIVWDFIDWAKRHDIPVGPGRGSGAGSIINYLIGITDIEPLWLNLFFERFINPERISYPDIDVDICMERRGEVIDYTVAKYGKECVAQIITFGTMKAKMAIKDVGRVLNVPLAKVNQIAGFVPEELGITIDKALETDPDLNQMYKTDDETHRLIDLAQKLEGVVRNTGIHAAGIIISGAPLTEHIPVCVAKDAEMAVTQYSMKPVEKVGMLKIDFLGLTTLTCIKYALAAIPTPLDPLHLPLDDAPTFALLNQGQTNGVFQMESGGMQELARGLHLDRFEEILAVVSLYRPGPMEMIPSFIARKHGKEPIHYDHEWMQEILAETYGIMVYQEQVMQIAQKLAGYSLGEGDVLRRAMGKKIMSEMAEQRAKFTDGATANQIDPDVATAVFDKMEQFAKYGFNKSHAASYGLLTYITAYLKANYPKEWMAALLTCSRDDTTKVARLIRECKAQKINILAPDVNEAGDIFVATKDGIRFAMSAVKGVGHGVVEAICMERSQNGPFKDLYDFFKRIDSTRVGKKVAETMCDAGCFDFTGWTRDELRLSCDPMHTQASRDQRDNEQGVISLFSLMEQPVSGPHERPVVAQPSERSELLMREKELLGFFLTGHPMDDYKPVIGRLSCISLSQLEQVPAGGVFRSAFIVETAVVKLSKAGRKFAILNISDGLATCEVPVWSDIYEENSHLIVENQLLYGVLQLDDDGRLKCHWLGELARVDEAMIRACDDAFDRAKMRHEMAGRREKRAKPAKKKAEKKVEVKQMEIKVDIDRVALSEIVAIKKLFRQHAGKTPVNILFQRTGVAVGAVEIGSQWGVEVTPNLVDHLRGISSIIEMS